MLSGSINFKGRTLGDVEMAVREALSRISNGNTSGADRNKDGNFDFTVDGEEPA